MVKVRLPILALALLALLAAIWAGLLRIGWVWPALRPLLASLHGPLMISAFLGTLIGLERAVAAGRRWAYVGPLLSGLGGLWLLTDWPQPGGQLLLTLGSLSMVVVFAGILRQHLAWHTGTMAMGSLTWLAGNALWLFGRPIYEVVLWWMAFLILTIAGERLELSRVLRPTSRVMALFVGSVVVFLGGALLGMFAYAAGVRLVGVGMVLLAAWFLRHDLAPRNLRGSGLVRFIAICLVSGYVWLLIGGLFAIAFGGMAAGPRYDAILHAVFLGFVFSMIFGHAPIILPALTGRTIPYSPLFYVPLVLLHVSLALRIAGDLALWGTVRRFGGLLNGVALLLFLAVNAASLILEW
jgi:hypothetical protein